MNCKLPHDRCPRCDQQVDGCFLFKSVDAPFKLGYNCFYNHEACQKCGNYCEAQFFDFNMMAIAISCTVLAVAILIVLLGLIPVYIKCCKNQKQVAGAAEDLKLQAVEPMMQPTTMTAGDALEVAEPIAKD